MGTTYITVHGTGDGEREPTVGEPPADIQWWRPESLFCRELLVAASEGSTIEPFAWSGANDEADRRSAAELLLKRCIAAEKAGEQLHLVGHSHGGSVIATALRYAAAERRKLPAMAAFTTVGTPFLKLRQKLMPWDRYDATGRAALAFVVIGAVVLIYSVANWSGLFSELFAMGAATSGAIGLAMLWFLGRSRRGIHSRHLMARFDTYFATRWIGISSIGDEAIGGLTHLRTLRTNLFQRDMLSPFVSSAVQFLVLGYIIAIWCWSTINPTEMGIFDVGKPGPLQPINAAHSALFGVLYDISSAVNSALDKIPGVDKMYTLTSFLGMSLIAIGLLLSYFAVLMAAMKLAELISEYVIGAPVAALLNGAVRGAIVGIGYGAVKVREEPGGLSSSPFLSEPHVEPLPEEIDGKVLTYARDSLAATFLASHHELFRVDPASKAGVTVAQAVMRHVSWSELVHTAYFRVPECRAHLVARIAGR